MPTSAQHVVSLVVGALMVTAGMALVLRAPVVHEYLDNEIGLRATFFMRFIRAWMTSPVYIVSSGIVLTFLGAISIAVFISHL